VLIAALTHLGAVVKWDRVSSVQEDSENTEHAIELARLNNDG
jgi:hypothetical protein